MNTLRELLIMGACLLLIGCNTIQGMGRDVERAGEVIQQSTNHNDSQ